jgi:hypothetical protein
MPTVAKGFHVDPDLPIEFDSTPNQDRPASHRNWWGIPYIVTQKGADGDILFDVRRLDGGAWDRSTSIGQADTLEGAVKICQRAAEDKMFECGACHAVTLARYSGPMELLEDGAHFSVVVCPVCGFFTNKIKLE